jgi:hypothetical protein
MIIGVCGFAGSGKDTFADYLTTNYGFKKHGFAYPLKEMARLAFGFSSDQLYGSQEIKEKEDQRYPFSGTCVQCHTPCTDLTYNVYAGTPRPQTKTHKWWCSTCDVFYKKYVTPRLALQTLGTEWGRTLYSNIWVDAALRDMRRDNGDWVLSDVRFRNEMEGIQDIGGVVVRLLRGEGRFNHPSETELSEIQLDTFDHVIDNNRTLDNLYEAIDDALPTLRYLDTSG